MAGAAWYRYGSITVVQGSPVVVGVATAFLSQVHIGDAFTLDGSKFYEIESIEDDTHLTLHDNFAEAGATNATYGILRNFNTTTNAALAAQLTALLASWQAREDQFRVWSNGVPTGGATDSTGAGATLTAGLVSNTVGGNGYYPLSDATGATVWYKCPAALAIRSADSDKVGGFVPSQTPAAKQIPVVAVDSTITFPRRVTAGGLTVANTEAFAAGSVYGNATNGLVVGGKVGTTNDFLLTTPTGTTIARVPTGTADVEFTEGVTTLKAIIKSTTNDHLGMDNGGELGYIRVMADGSLDIWSHGATANEIWFRQGTGSGAIKGGFHTSGAFLLNTTTENGSGAKLQVNGSANFSSYITITGTSVGTGNQRWIGSNGATSLYYNAPAGQYHIWAFNNENKLVLASNGLLMVNKDTDDGSGAKLQVNGKATIKGGLEFSANHTPSMLNNYDVSFQVSDNTHLSIIMKGGDGVSRAVTLVLA